MKETIIAFAILVFSIAAVFWFRRGTSYHRRYRMIHLKDGTITIAIWHGQDEGWKIFGDGHAYHTVPLFSPSQLRGIPKPPHAAELRFCASKDGRSLGFYAVNKENERA